MKVNDVISKYYSSWYKMLKNSDLIICDGNTYEDIYHNILITAMNHYGKRDVDEQECYEYIKKTLLTEFLFVVKRKGKDIVVLQGDITPKDNVRSDSDF